MFAVSWFKKIRDWASRCPTPVFAWMAAVASVVLDHMRRVVSLLRGNSNMVPGAHGFSWRNLRVGGSLDSLAVWVQSLGHGGTFGEDVPVLHQLAIRPAHRSLCLCNKLERTQHLSQTSSKQRIRPINGPKNSMWVSLELFHPEISGSLFHPTFWSGLLVYSTT